MLVRGAFQQLFKTGLRDNIIYKDPPLFKLNKRFHKSYSLGFRVTREMVEDDLYGDSMIIVKKGNKKKLVLKVSYSVDVGYQEITRTNDTFNIPSMGLTIEDTKQLVKALNLLLKVKAPTKKVTRKRRKNVKA